MIFLREKDMKRGSVTHQWTRFLRSGRPLRVVVLAWLLLAAAATGGCKHHAKPVMAGTRHVPLKVFVVLGPGESVGNNMNVGCRLTEDDIKNVIHQAQKNAGVFGTGTVFDWDEVVTQLTDHTAANYGRTGVAGNLAELLFSYPSEFHLNTDFVTIFFTGNFGEDAHPWANTVAPNDVSDLAAELQPGLIMINDGGWTDSAGSQPDAILSRLTLPHEMGHYFSSGRWNSRTFGAGTSSPRVYDNKGHITVVGAPYLMIEGSAVINNQRTAFVPGSDANPDGAGGSDEKGLVSSRINLGTWNLP